MQMDYSKLSGRITEKCKHQQVFAQKMGRSTRTISLKMTGKIPWTQEEIGKALKVLDLDTSDIPTYFFTEKVKTL